MSAYTDQLKHPKWQRRRLEIMQRDGFACKRCSADDKTLNVHHKLYHSGAAPWEYADDELVTLCEDCHEAEHKETFTRAEVVALLKPLAEQLAELRDQYGRAVADAARLALQCDRLELDREPPHVKALRYQLAESIRSYTPGNEQQAAEYRRIDREFKDARAAAGLH